MYYMLTAYSLLLTGFPCSWILSPEFCFSEKQWNRVRNEEAFQGWGDPLVTDLDKAGVSEGL